MEKNCKKFSDTEYCPVRNVLSRFGDKWSLLVIGVLSEVEVMRFGELHKTIGDVSQKVLTSTLRTLETDGLIKRTIYPEVPPKVEYTMTPLGKTLIPRIQLLAEWATENLELIKKTRAKNSTTRKIKTL